MLQRLQHMRVQRCFVRRRQHSPQHAALVRLALVLRAGQCTASFSLSFSISSTAMALLSFNIWSNRTSADTI